VLCTGRWRWSPPSPPARSAWPSAMPPTLRQGLSNIARRVTGARAKPWCLSIHAKASLSLSRRVIQRTLNPGFSSKTASYDVASNIWQARPTGGAAVGAPPRIQGGQDVQGDRAARRGKAVQVAPITPTLKAPGTQHLKQKPEKLLSIYGFKFNLRRYNVAAPSSPAC